VNTKKIIALIVVFSLLLGSQVVANSKEMLLLLPGFPGNSKQAQPYLDKIFRHIEKKLKWENNSLSGAYIPDGKLGSAKIAEKKPYMALIGPSIYVANYKNLKMKIIAKVEANGRGDEIYSIVTRKDGPSTLQELEGKNVEGCVTHDEKYVYKVILDNLVNIGSYKLTSQKKPLKTLRNLIRGKTDAAIIDQTVKEHLNELPFAKDIKIIYTSKKVPAPVVVVMGEGKKHINDLKKALIGLCKNKEGSKLCKTLTISSIKEANEKDYKILIKSYNR